jgi:arylsulfatase A-like enzyme
VIRARLAGLALLALVGVCSFGAGAQAVDRTRPLVIVLSWDGVRWDYPDRGQTPSLARMQRDGVRAERLTPVFPSVTFPNHVTLATGTYPDRHGIIANRFHDAQGKLFDGSDIASWIEAEPLWVTAERQNVRAAVYYWVGSDTDWRGHGATYRVAPFDASVPESAKVEQILRWVDLPADTRPGLIMSYWSGCDSEGHSFGPDAPEVTAKLALEDRALAALLAGLDARGAWTYTTVIVTSDHGMTAIREVADLQSPLAAVHIAAQIEYSIGEAQVYLADPAQRDAALRAYAGHNGFKAYPSDALPPELARGHFAGRGGQITAVGEPPYALGRGGMEGFFARWWHWLHGSIRQGAHGYPPSHPDMGAIFFALGRGIPPGTELGEVRSIDVAPTVAALLGIDPPQSSEGKALFESQTASKSDAKP